MSNDELEAVDPVLESLFADERARGRAPGGAKNRVLQRVERSIGGGFDGTAGSGGGLGGSTPTGMLAAGRMLPLLGAFLVGGAIGGLGVHKLTQPRVIYVTRPETPPLPVPRAEPSTITSTIPAAAPSVSTGVAVANDGSEPPDTLSRERTLLDVARTALGRANGAGALDAVNRHAREFPHGQMSEEREAIAVQALVRLDRREDAAIRGARFHRRWPNSVLGPVVDAALATSGGNPPRREPLQ